MKYPCETVKDLLPLYHDAVCSETSKRIVEEHLFECGSCKSELIAMDDTTVDNRLRDEREGALGRFAKKFKRRSLFAGICVASVLAVPILVCLIVNLATGHGLDWFFIVLTSLLVLASLTVVPLVAEERKGLWTLGSFTGSLLLLLGTICLYGEGRWFFVVATPILFGLTLIFLPGVLRALPLPDVAARHRALLVMAADTLLLYVLILVTVRPAAWHVGLGITSAWALFAWLLFVLIRYVKLSRLTKAGLCILAGSLTLPLALDFTNWLADGHGAYGMTGRILADANLSAWNMMTADANAKLLLAILSCVVGAALLAIGLILRKQRKDG